MVSDVDVLLAAVAPGGNSRVSSWAAASMALVSSR